MLIASHPGQGHITFSSFNVLAFEYFDWQERFGFILRMKQVWSSNPIETHYSKAPVHA